MTILQILIKKISLNGKLEWKASHRANSTGLFESLFIVSQGGKMSQTKMGFSSSSSFRFSYFHGLI